MSSVGDYNQRIIDEFRANGGKAPSWGGSSPLLLLHHRGAKTGVERVNPVVYLQEDERYVVFASKAGAPTNPAWYHNLKAHPDTTIEVRGDTVAVTAREVTGDERARLFRAQAERSPQFVEYQHKTDRLIPVLVLTPARAVSGRDTRRFRAERGKAPTAWRCLCEHDTWSPRVGTRRDRGGPAALRIGIESSCDARRCDH